MTGRQKIAVAALLICGCVCPRRAHAYRPFDSTDASVAARGEIELECGPLGYVIDAEGRFLVVPGAILNFGVAQSWEVVLEGRNWLRVNGKAGDRRDILRDTALSLKGVLRQGSVQDRSGPSVAVELSLLLPTIGGEPGAGAAFTSTLSQRWSAATVHVNGALLVTRDHTVGTFAGAILEGPFRWAVRPVAEFTVEQADGRTVSALAGAIWQVRDGLSLDVGWRASGTNDLHDREFRAGFTWGFPIGGRRSDHASIPIRRTSPRAAL